MEVSFIIQIPVANPVRFTLDGVTDNERASFDKRRYFKTINATTQQRSWRDPLESTDPLRIQYYSNYPLQRLQVVNCDDTIIYQTYTPELAVQYKGKKFRSDAKFSSINDKLFIYFQSGVEYEDEDFLVSGDTVNLLGRLPNIRAVAGDIIRYKVGADFEVSSVASIQWSPALQSQGYLTDIDYTLLTPIDGLFEITYDEKEANLYTQAVNLLPLIEGEYLLKLSFGVSAFTRNFYTEPLDIKISHPKTLSIEYSHRGTFEEEDIWSYLYLSDWTNIIRMPTDFYEVEVAGEVDLDTNDNGAPRMLRAVPYRQLAFKAYNIPGWKVDKLSVVFSHDTKRINEYYWENEALGEYNIISRADLGTFEIKLRQVNDRTNFTTEFTEEVTAQFIPDSFEDLEFGGEVVTAQFVSNTLGVFSFVSLPAWISTDHPTFVNGDIIEFTIAANAALFERSIQLVAISESFDGLQATIDFHQLYDDTEPQFIDVDDHEVILEGIDGSEQLLNVTSSGDYDIVPVSGFSFTVVKESGFTQLRITAPSENEGPAERTAVIRLELQANPAVFTDINVTQLVRVGLFGSAPTAFTFEIVGGSGNAFIEASTSTQWQATSSHPSWCSVDTGLKTGSQNISIFVSSRDFFETAPRFAQITIVNVNDPLDTLTIIVQQN